MDCEFLIVSSITYALKAKSELESHGIVCKVEKIKNVAALGGCGHGLKVSKSISNTARRYLNLAGIKVVDTVDCGAKRP